MLPRPPPPIDPRPVPTGPLFDVPGEIPLAGADALSDSRVRDLAVRDEGVERVGADRQLARRFLHAKKSTGRIRRSGYGVVPWTRSAQEVRSTRQAGRARETDSGSSWGSVSANAPELPASPTRPAPTSAKPEAASRVAGALEIALPGGRGSRMGTRLSAPALPPDVGPAKRSAPGRRRLSAWAEPRSAPAAASRGAEDRVPSTRARTP